MKVWAWSLALAVGVGLGACRTDWPTPRPRLALAGEAPGSLSLRLLPPRGLLQVARAWRPSDVAEYRVGLRKVAPEGVASSGPELRSSPWGAAPLRFTGLDPGGRYRVQVEAWGAEGGATAALCLNQQRPTEATFDLGASGPQLSAELPVWLDARDFSLDLPLPSQASEPGSIPAWCTGLEVALHEAGASTALLRLAYDPQGPMRLEGLRGDRSYDVALTVRSAAGQRTQWLRGLRRAKGEGASLRLEGSFLPLQAPSGTLLNRYALPSTFNLAIDGQDHLWITNQHHDTVTELAASGGAVLRTLAVGDQPRGVAVDRTTGQVWVSNFSSGTLSRIQGGAVVGTHGAGLFPAGLAVDGQGRAFLANALFGQLRVLSPTGGALPGSPFSAGAGAAAVAHDPGQDQVWVSNANAASLHRWRQGVMAGPFPTGASPGGLAVAPDGTLWVPCNGDSTLRAHRPDGSASGAAIPLATGPSAIAIQPSGELWVTLLGWNGLAKLSPQGQSLGAWAVGHFPAGLAIDGRGHVWVVGDGKVSEFAP